MSAGLRFEIGKMLVERGFKRPLLVADSGIAALDIFSKLCQSLESAGLNVAKYHDFQGNPVEADVIAGANIAKSHTADAMVIIGGGAALDVGKAIGLMTYNPGTLFDYEDIPGAREATELIPFMVTIPTTAGTGSEVGRSSVISENISKAKKIIFSPKLLPPLVIVDPELTVGLPQHVTAATGMDALTHLIEAYLAKGYHPMCDGIALQGIKMVGENLALACSQPNNLTARGEMLMAALMGAVAFQKGLGITHSCAHALSTVFDLHHGLANSLMLKACMNFNRVAVPERFSDMARMVGIYEEKHELAGNRFIAWIKELQKEIGLDKSLGEYGVSINDRLLDVAYSDICHPLGPRSATRNDIKNLYEESL